MFQNSAHEVFINLVRRNEAIHGRGVVQRVNSRLNGGVAGRSCKAGFFEQILAIDHHLGPAVNRNCSCHAVKLRHSNSAWCECIFLKRIYNVRICFYI